MHGASSFLNFTVRARPPVRSASTRLGTDLVWIPEIEQSVARFGLRYLQRLFTARELHDCLTADGSHRSASLAARFAAKEATMKALAVAANYALPWHAIAIHKQNNGSPLLCLTGAARSLAQHMQLHEAQVSLSHEHEYASATVLLHCRRR